MAGSSALMSSITQPMEDMTHNDNESSSLVALAGEATAVTVAAKKSRGRPRKVPIAKVFPKQRGRPLKAKKPITDTKTHDQTDTESSNSSKEKRKPGRPRKIIMDQDDTPKITRPRGRPKKTTTENINQQQQQQTKNFLSSSSKSSDRQSSLILQQPKRGRGRPPKLKNEETDPVAKTTTKQSEKRGRGRPRKVKVDEKQQSDLVEPPKEKRGRGRPRKANIEPEHSGEQQSQQDHQSSPVNNPIKITQRNVVPAGSIKRGRGRPKKEKNEEDEEKIDNKMEDILSQQPSKANQRISSAGNNKSMQAVDNQSNAQSDDEEDDDDTITSLLGVRHTQDSMIEDTVIHPIPSTVTDTNDHPVPFSSSSKLVSDNVQNRLSPPDIIITTANESERMYGKSRKRSKEPNADVTSKKRAKHFKY